MFLTINNYLSLLKSINYLVSLNIINIIRLLSKKYKILLGFFIKNRFFLGLFTITLTIRAGVSLLLFSILVEGYLAFITTIFLS